MNQARPWVKFDRFGLLVERLQVGGGRRSFSAYRIEWRGRWSIDFSDWSLSRRTGENAWSQVGPAFRCGLCHAWTLGCKAHWFCGLCSACDAWAEDLAVRG